MDATHCCKNRCIKAIFCADVDCTHTHTPATQTSPHIPPTLPPPDFIADEAVRSAFHVCTTL